MSEADKEAIMFRSGVALVGIALLTTACGSSSNLNQIWGGSDDAGDTLLIDARMAYDRGDFSEAEKLAEKLIATNPDNETAAVLLGYAYLSHGGIDPFRLARELIAIQNEEKNGTDTSAALTDAELFGDAAEMRSLAMAAQQQSGTSSGSAEDSSSDASTTLTKLQARLLNLSDSDKTALVESTTNSGLFASAPISVPRKITDDVRNGVTTLSFMNKAMRSVCRFVNDGAKVEGDSRDTDAACTIVDFERKNAAKAHFLWAFSHLTEALVYQSVLLTSTVESGKSNFQVAVDSLNNKKFENVDGIQQFVTDVQDLRTVINSVFDTSDDSMLTATLRDLTAVQNAFDQMVGLPDEMKTQITNAMAKINDVATKLNEATTKANQVGLSDKSKALKGQMTSKFSKTVGSKIDKVVEAQAQQAGGDPATFNQSTAQGDEKTKLDSMCDSYKSLAEGMDPDSAETNKPKACNQVAFKK